MNAPMRPRGPALAIATGDGLASALRHGGLGEFQAASDFAACLMPLLHALGWRGDVRQIAESLPHFASGLNLDDFQNVMARLNFEMREVSANADTIDPRLLPAMLVREDGRPALLLERTAGGYRIFDGGARSELEVATETIIGRFFFIRVSAATEQDEMARKDNWVRALFSRFKPLILQLFLLTFVLNVISLGVPLFTMALYDQVIPMQAHGVLAYLAAGLALAFGIDFLIRMVRARLTAWMGGRIEHLVATATFAKVLSLPPALTESAPLGAQISRMKEFDSLRDLFMGPLVSVLLEIPFVLLFILVIAAVGGPIAWIPVVLLAVFALVGALMLPGLKRSVATAGRARAKRHGFLVEMIRHLRTVKESSAEGIWSERYRAVSAEAAYSHFRQSQLNYLLQTLAQSFMMAAGVATIAWGVIRVVDGDMTIGGLIAAMTLVWRVLTPIQQLFLTLTRFESIEVSIRQINQLMRMPAEEGADTASSTSRRFHGEVAFNRVSFRYSNIAEPALLGVNLSIRQGELIAIMGGNGAGKSTLLNIAAAMHRPQAGLITIDGLDIRQVAPIELRQSIAYLPQRVNLFHGTIAQNLRLSLPTASDEDLREAAKLAGVLPEIEALPRGFETRLGDGAGQHFNSGFIQRIGLARTFLKKAPVILLDEPAQNLDEAGDARFMETLAAMKGKTTIIMVSHRPSHVRLADWAAIMDNGMVAATGKPDEILARMFGGK